MYDVIKKYNLSIEEVEKNIKLATDLNLRLAKLEIKDLLDNLEATKKDFVEKKKKYDILESEKKDIQNSIDGLRSKMSNLNVALELIN